MKQAEKKKLLSLGGETHRNQGRHKVALRGNGERQLHEVQNRRFRGGFVKKKKRDQNTWMEGPPMIAKGSLYKMPKRKTQQDTDAQSRR